MWKIKDSAIIVYIAESLQRIIFKIQQLLLLKRYI